MCEIHINNKHMHGGCFIIVQFVVHDDNLHEIWILQPKRETKLYANCKTQLSYNPGKYLYITKL